MFPLTSSAARTIALAFIAGLVLVIETQIQADSAVRHGLSILAIVAGLWMTETLHITLTALLVPVLATVAGILSVKEALNEFANPIIFLFLGGFALASALHKQGIDRHLANQVLRVAGGRPARAVLLLGGLSAVLSMWISNTAATAIMLPLVIGLIDPAEGQERTRIFALLAVAYSASIGGIATVVGSPPNAIVAAQLGLSFMDWLRLGLPIALMLWPLMLLALYVVLRPTFAATSHLQINAQAFEWTPGRRRVVSIFVVTVTLWLFSSPLSKLLGIARDLDSLIAIGALLALAISKTVTWKDIEGTTDWGVLLLFGGGLTLSVVLKASGASGFLGGVLSEGVAGWSPYFIVLAITTFVVFLTELSSNTATAALLLPLFLALPESMVSPLAVAMAIGVSASCAFMLPVATPPNALVHGTGLVPQRTMMRAGLVLNLMCCGLISVWASAIGS